jgi:hypothetical protein
MPSQLGCLVLFMVILGAMLGEGWSGYAGGSCSEPL